MSADDDGRFRRIESRIGQAEAGLTGLTGVTQKLAQLQSRDHETIHTLRDVAGPSKMQDLTTKVAVVEQKVQSPLATQADLSVVAASVAAIDAKHDALVAVVDGKLTTHASDASAARSKRDDKLAVVEKAVTGLQSQSKIIYALLAAIGLTILSGIGAMAVNHFGK